MSSNKRKDITLGMPHGTASSRLRKNILFFLLKKHNENLCIRCEQPIERVEELSIEHIKPWEGISADLFWDLQNIAFSHLYCNRPHRFSNGDVNIGKRIKIRTSKGTAWCTGCRAPKQLKDFHKDRRSDDGVNDYCKDCRKLMRADICEFKRLRSVAESATLS